ncbi:MAG TPA: thiol:disulfide interchange protein [candidate division Zixibacteria bacterium]|nr:thiol:disulfide interchange protein [candidate division Zixibacteria bacterium]
MESLAVFIQNNPAFALVAVFAGGLISAASPCVLAVIPLVIGYVGGYSQGDKKKALKYSLIFALGLAIAFTLLGAAAGFIGSFLGLTGKYFFWAIAVIAIIMGLSLIGFFEIRFPFKNKLQVKTGGLLGAFLMGLLFGIASSPCATPVLVVILAYVATKGQILYGTLLLFTYAIAHCALIILAGAVTGFVESFAKSKGIANFSIWAKKVSGALIIFAGGYILYLNR